VDKKIAIVAKLGRVDAFALMDLFHKRSQSATINENGGVLKGCATELERENGQKKPQPLTGPCARLAIKNRGIQSWLAAARGNESDSIVSRDVGMQTEPQC
jgi:hypothetical protein